MVRLPRTPRRNRRLAVSANVVAQLLLATWLLLIVNGWAFKNSWRVDLTRDKKYALDPSTEQFIRQLPRGVDVVVAFSNRSTSEAALAQQALDRAIRLCEEFQLVNPSFRLAETVDVLRDPAGWDRVKERYSIEAPDCVYLFSGDRRETLLPTDMASFRLPSASNPNVTPELVSERVAEALAAAVKRVVSLDQPVIRFTQGSGEMSVESPRGQWSLGLFRRSLVDRGYEVETIDLRTTEDVPPKTDLLVLVCGGPDGFEPLRGQRRDAVERYLDGGGSLLVFLPFTGATGLERLLTNHGILPGDTFVAVDGPSPGRRSGPTTFQIAGFVNEGHPAALGLTFGEFEAEVDSYRHLQLDPESPAQALLSSSDDSWLERDLSLLRRHESDPVGRFPLVAASEVAAGSRVVVFGSWSSILDPSPTRRAGRYGKGVQRLVLGSVHWLVREELGEVGSGRELAVERIPLTAGLLRAYRWSALVVLPGCSILAGLFAFWLRRRGS